MLINAWNWFYNFALTVESISFVLAALLVLLALANGKTGLKKLKKPQEARLWKLAVYCIYIKLGTMAFTLLVQLIFYFRR